MFPALYVTTLPLILVAAKEGRQNDNTKDNTSMAAANTINVLFITTSLSLFIFSLNFTSLTAN
jgi:hypothetical protein